MQLLFVKFAMLRKEASPGRMKTCFGYIKYSLTDTLQSKRMWKRAYYQVAVKGYLLYGEKITAEWCNA